MQISIIYKEGHVVSIRKNKLRSIEKVLCPEIRGKIKKLPSQFKEEIEEIRLRVNQPLMIFANNTDFFITVNNGVSKYNSNSYIVEKNNIETTLQFIANYSIYSVVEELKQGFITIEGGHRIGIVGSIVSDNLGIKTMKEFTGLNLRIAGEKIDVSKKIMPYLINCRGEFRNTLIISPPQCGKTTLLRDIIRNISNGIPDLNLRGLKVGVVDERSEIAACYDGVPQNNLGIRTDILNRCPKAQGMMMLIRSMSPQVIATDELGREDEIMAISEAVLAGINLITTVHGKSLEDILNRRLIGDLIKEGIFKRIIILSSSKGVGTIEEITDGVTLNKLTNYPIENRIGG